MRNKFFGCVLIIFMATSIAWSNTAEISQILRQTRELMESKSYSEAQSLILAGLRNNRRSHKLWLALGYVFEAEGQYEKALQAFYRARDLQFGIEGLPERIIRIQKIIETQKDGNIDTKLPLVEQARQNINQKRIKAGLELFVEAVFNDRSLLASENEIIVMGMDYFTDENNLVEESERTYYSGIYGFFSGNHDLAANNLERFIENYPENDKIERAKEILVEVKALLQQLQQAIAQQQTETRPGARPAGQTPASIARPTTSEGTASARPAIRRPPPAPKDEYSGMSTDDLYSEALNLANRRPIKAIDLLSRITVTESAQPEHFMTLGDIYSSHSGFEKEAMRAYRDLIERYPGSDLAEEAKQKILQRNPSAEERSRQVHEHFSTQP